MKKNLIIIFFIHSNHLSYIFRNIKVMRGNEKDIGIDVFIKLRKLLHNELKHLSEGGVE